jgi:hypothetical protein
VYNIYTKGERNNAGEKTGFPKVCRFGHKFSFTGLWKIKKRYTAIGH